MSIAELLDPRDPPTGADPEPTTFDALDAAGWVAKGSHAKWRSIIIGAHDVTLFPDGAIWLDLVDGAAPLSEADACRLAHRLATVLCDFRPTP